MAIITALVTATKVLASQGMKKAAISGAKGLVKKKAKNFVTGKGKKKKPAAIQKRNKGRGGYTSEPGAIVRTGSSAVTPLVEGISKSTQKSSTDVSSGGSGSVSDQLIRILGLTKTIDGIVKSQYKTQKDNAKKARTAAEKDKKRDREEGRESLLGKAGRGILGAARGAANKFGIMNFITNILMGAMAVALVKNIDKVIAAFEFLGKNLHLVWLGIKTLLMAFKGIKTLIFKAVRWAGGKIFKGALRLIKGGFRLVGKAVTGLFRLVGRTIVKMVTGAYRAARNLAAGARTPGQPPKPKPATGPRTPGTGKPVTGKPTNTNNIIPFRRSGTPSTVASGAATGARTARGLKGMSRFKGIASAFRSGIRIPIVGPLIVAVLTYIETEGNAGQAIFEGVGALLGGALGSGIGAAIGTAILPGVLTAAGGVLGSLLGEVIGEYIGEIFYMSMSGKSIGDIWEKISTDVVKVFKSVMNFGKWAGEGLSKFYEGTPKLQFPDLSETEVKAPDWLGGWSTTLDLNPFAYGPINAVIKSTTGKGIQDVAIPDPFWWMNPLTLPEKAKLFQKSFFGDGDVKEGKVEKPKAPKAPKPPVELKGQSKQISEDDMYLQEGVGYFDSKTQRFLGKTKEQAESTFLARSGGEDDAIPETDEHSEGEGLGGSVSTNFDFNPGEGDKSRKIFLHWTAGSHSKAYPAYHTTFLGSGKAVRSTPYGQDKGSHTAGGNTNSVGLSVAAMGGAGVNENNFGSQPPTAAQLDAMTTEAAQLAYAWGWDAATVESNVRTHGEWERYATKNGLLPGGPQRWDLDKLKQSDPDIDVSKVLSSGGSKLRSMIKNKLAKLKSGGAPTRVQPAEAKAVGLVSPSSTSSTEDQIRDVSASEAKVDDTSSSQTETKKPYKPPVMKRHWNEVRIGKNKGMGRSGELTSPDTFPPETESQSSPKMSSQSSPGSSTGGIEREAYYDDPEQGSTTVIPFPIESPMKKDSGGGSSSELSGSSKSSMLNSYHKQQILGSLYKQG